MMSLNGRLISLPLEKGKFAEVADSCAEKAALGCMEPRQDVDEGDSQSDDDAS